MHFRKAAHGQSSAPELSSAIACPGHALVPGSPRCAVQQGRAPHRVPSKSGCPEVLCTRAGWREGKG